jgi:hypothetical protein
VEVAAALARVPPQFRSLVPRQRRAVRPVLLRVLPHLPHELVEHRWVLAEEAREGREGGGVLRELEGGGGAREDHGPKRLRLDGGQGQRIGSHTQLLTNKNQYTNVVNWKGKQQKEKEKIKELIVEGRDAPAGECADPNLLYTSLHPSRSPCYSSITLHIIQKNNNDNTF